MIAEDDQRGVREDRYSDRERFGKGILEARRQKKSAKVSRRN
jgi:hypothetical protein